MKLSVSSSKSSCSIFSWLCYHPKRADISISMQWCYTHHYTNYTKMLHWHHEKIHVALNLLKFPDLCFLITILLMTEMPMELLSIQLHCRDWEVFKNTHSWSHRLILSIKLMIYIITWVSLVLFFSPGSKQFLTGTFAYPAVWYTIQYGIIKSWRLRILYPHTWYMHGYFWAPCDTLFVTTIVCLANGQDDFICTSYEYIS